MANRRRQQLAELRVPVSEDHIRFGIPNDINHCSFADALYDAYPELKHVRVAEEKLSFTNGDLRYTLDQPAEVRAIMATLDGLPPDQRDYGLAGEITIDLRSADVRPKAKLTRRARKAPKPKPAKRTRPRAVVVRPAR
jgi:hypothetical protein